ncbi:MAG TPA: homoserine dehydrogenase [Anaerolineae bacterium]|nr:homoserine dehydrogenase [Anaerolineae bacterium]
MNNISLVMIGFGNVGQAFAHLLIRKRQELQSTQNLNFRITGIATGSHGCVLNQEGLDTRRAIALMNTNQPLTTLSQQSFADTLALIRNCQSDTMIENTPVNYQSGQPAVKHIETALSNGMHVVSANKGPIAHAYQELTSLEGKVGKTLLFESTVMDGAPIFSLFRQTLPAAKLISFEGILNSCTNLILEQMEDGKSFDEAVNYAKSIGITETDPSGDIDGWDAAIKVAILVTVLMNMPLKPQEVNRTGIRDITSETVKRAKKEGKRWKLVCRAQMQGEKLHASVAPELVVAGSPLFSVNGTSSFIHFHTDVLPGLGLLEGNPGPETTAYGLLADLISIYQK